MLDLLPSVPGAFHAYPVGGGAIPVTFPFFSSFGGSHEVSEQCSTLTLQNINPASVPSLAAIVLALRLYSLLNWTEISHGDQRCLQMLRYGFTCFLRLSVCYAAKPVQTPQR